VSESRRPQQRPRISLTETEVEIRFAEIAERLEPTLWPCGEVGCYHDLLRHLHKGQRRDCSVPHCLCVSYRRLTRRIKLRRKWRRWYKRHLNGTQKAGDL
jgi:hypothetical protein